MDLVIRKATITDLSTLLAINQSSFMANEAFDRYINMNWIHTPNAKKRFITAITDKDHYTTVAEAAGKPVGFLVLAPKELAYRTVRTVELDILAVLPQYRSQGIGSKLVTDAKAWAKAEGYTTMMVSSYSKNDRAVEFYTRRGFETVDISLEIVLD